MKTHKRLFIETWGDLPYGYDASHHTTKEDLWDRMEKELLEAIEKDGDSDYALGRDEALAAAGIQSQPSFTESDLLSFAEYCDNHEGSMENLFKQWKAKQFDNYLKQPGR